VRIGTRTSSGSSGERSYAGFRTNSHAPPLAIQQDMEVRFHISRLV